MAGYSQGQVLEDKQGNRVRLEGNRWVPMESRTQEAVRQAQEQIARDTPAWQAALIGAGRALGGGWLYGDDGYEALQRERPVSTFVGGVAPAVLTGIVSGGATAGLGLGARVGITAASEAGMGALGDPQDPLGSAAMGAGFAGLGAAAPAAIGAARRAVPGVVERAATAATVLPMPQRVQARIMGIAGGAEGGAGGGGRGAIPPATVRTVEDATPGSAGWYSPAEAAERSLPLTPGDEMFLAARSPGERTLARTVRENEELRRSDPLAGRGIANTREAQKQWVTDRITQELDLPAGTPLSPAVMGQKFDDVGRVYDEIAGQMGAVPVSKTALGDLEGIVEDARSAYQGRLGKVHISVEEALNKNNGVLTFEDWMHTKNQIDKAVATASRQGDAAALGDFTAYRDTLFNSLMDSAPPELQHMLTQANHQYRILKLLTHTAGTVSPEGAVNIAQFRNNMGKMPARFKNARQDDLARAIDTLTLLQGRLTPSSGTAERLLLNMASKAPQTAATGLAAAAGVAAINKVFGSD